MYALLPRNAVQNCLLAELLVCYRPLARFLRAFAVLSAYVRLEAAALVVETH
jgi:hypothetical protein